MILKHACGHETDEPLADNWPKISVDFHESRPCWRCKATEMVQQQKEDDRFDMAQAIACALAPSCIHSDAHLSQWAAKAVKMADTLIAELEKPK